MNAWIVQMLVASTVLMAAVHASRGLVARTLGPRAAYALWALPALRVVTPSLPGWRSLGALVWSPVPAIAPAPPEGSGAILPAAAALPISGPMAHASPGWLADLVAAWPAVVVCLWLAGAALMMGWQTLSYLYFLRGAMGPAERWARRERVEILLTPAVDGPVATGVLRRRIFLPPDFMSRYAPAERRLALLHEMQHHRSGDIMANLFAMGVLAVHWWNPLAYRAYQAFRADQELACDAWVLAAADAEERDAYGRAVLKSATGPTSPLVCALSRKSELKRRLLAMAGHGCGARRARLGGVVAAVAVGAGLLGTASGQVSAPGGRLQGRPAPEASGDDEVSAAGATTRSGQQAAAWRGISGAQAETAQGLVGAGHAPARSLRRVAEGRREAARQVQDDLGRSVDANRAWARRAADDRRRLAEQARLYTADQLAAAGEERSLGGHDGARTCCAGADTTREAAREVRQAQEDARREIRLGRLDAQRAAEEARREAAQGRREADRARAEAQRELAEADRRGGGA